MTGMNAMALGAVIDGVNQEVGGEDAVADDVRSL
jgi:hypothetical protein